jgi:hypothetical protein
MLALYDENSASRALWTGRIESVTTLFMKRALCSLWFTLMCAGAFAQDAIPVFEEAPPTYDKIDTVSASSQSFSGRTRSAKRSYVIREMQRQAQALGANALLITEMQEYKEVKPVYGRRPGSMDYEKVVQFRGAGLAIRVADELLPVVPAVDSEP